MSKVLVICFAMTFKSVVKMCLAILDICISMRYHTDWLTIPIITLVKASVIEGNFSSKYFFNRRFILRFLSRLGPVLQRQLSDPQ